MSAIPYKSLTTMADGMNAYCSPCGDFYIYECTTDECGGLICVCCDAGCDECGGELTFG